MFAGKNPTRALFLTQFHNIAEIAVEGDLNTQL
jgi:hypothetical protein